MDVAKLIPQVFFDILARFLPGHSCSAARSR